MPRYSLFVAKAFGTLLVPMAAVILLPRGIIARQNRARQKYERNQFSVASLRGCSCPRKRNRFFPVMNNHAGMLARQVGPRQERPDRSGRIQEASKSKMVATKS